tara:strand:- start:1 stop:249 length:249 start_codon:yes stop_codon:yes gene_type:complete
MNKAMETLKHLIPNGEWTILGDDFNSIIYNEGTTPITKKQFDDTMKIIESIKQAEEDSKATAKAALLEKLGITSEEASLLLS